MVEIIPHSFPKEAVDNGLKAYRALVERERKADEWMASPTVTDEAKLAEFFRYKAEIVDARLSYERMFRGFGIEF